MKLITLAALTLSAGTLFALSSPWQIKTPPALGPAPKLILPAEERGTLPNGLTVVVARNAEVPLVEGRLIINGGARLAGVPQGLATFSALMVTEGAGGRDAFQLAEAIDFLGASLGAKAGWENVTLSIDVPKRNVDSALVLMSDLLFRPTFAQKDVARQRDLRQAAFVSARDNPAAVASRVFFRSMFPAGHPYHDALNGDSASTAKLDSAAVRNFWNGALDPKQATLVMSGDVTLKEATAWATRYFGAWSTPATPLTRSAASSVAPPPATPTRVVLVDKPAAAQSVIYVGLPGVDRGNPDYPAILVMNTLLGGSFSSRINDILREQRGYSYGASAAFYFAPVPGPFAVNSSVRTNVTDSSLVIIFRELRRIRDSLAPDIELNRVRNYVVLGSLGDYETAGQVVGALYMSQLFGRPLATITDELEAMKKVSAADVQRVAQKYLDPTKMTVVVVGDLKVIKPAIEKLKLGSVSVEKY